MKLALAHVFQPATIYDDIAPLLQRDDALLLEGFEGASNQAIEMVVKGSVFNGMAESTTRSHKLWSGLEWEPAKGFEPLACGLRNRCSAAELRRRSSLAYRLMAPL